MGYLGNSHFGLEDIAVMRTIPGLNISSPADWVRWENLYDYAFKNLGPSYIRLTGIPDIQACMKNYSYKFGEPITLRNGKDALILSTGSMVCQSIIADILSEKNIKVELMNIHTLKPLNEKIK